MKKYITAAVFGLAALLTVTASFASVNGTTKTSASSEEKFTTLDKGTIVKDGNITTAYNKRGNWVYTIEHYSADNLPLDIFKTVRSRYGNCYIAGIDKVDQPGAETVYIVHTEDNATYKTVRVTNSDTDVIQEFSKQ